MKALLLGQVLELWKVLCQDQVFTQSPHVVQICLNLRLIVVFSSRFVDVEMVLRVERLLLIRRRVVADCLLYLCLVREFE